MARPDLTQFVDGRTALFVPQGGDLDFTVEWKLADGTQVTILSADGELRKVDGDDEILDLSAYITIASGKASIHVPRSITKELTDWGEGYWSLVATSATSSKMLLEGPASLRRGAARD